MIFRLSKSVHYPSFLASSDCIIRRHFFLAFQSPWRAQEFPFPFFLISHIVPFRFLFTEQGSALRHEYHTAF